MTYSHILLRVAQKDYEEAILWYADKSMKAAENLILEIEHTLELICNNPTRWRLAYKDYRELSLKKFPYSIVYFVKEETQQVVITSIRHFKRNPKGKYRKAE